MMLKGHYVEERNIELERIKEEASQNE